MRYLTTKRDWRYKTPWMLLIGEPGSGKSRFIQAVNEGRRAQLLPQEKRLRDPQSGWHFFDHAVVIDQDNKKRGNSSDKSEDDSKDLGIDESERESRFAYLLQLLHWYRPERPVDGIILTVNAKTLLHDDEPAALNALGESLFKQLWQAQKQSGLCAAGLSGGDPV